jgi:microcompartment protein CcmL/EutN
MFCVKNLSCITHMMETIGFLETNSIAKGIEAADAILKAADVALVFSRATCPGKYITLFTGEVAAVTASLEAGTACAGTTAVDSTVIARVHPQVIAAMNLGVAPEEVNAMGIMEFFSVTAAVYAADAAVKASEISLTDVRLGTGIGGKSFVVCSGSVAAVNEAVNCGTQAGAEKGLVVSSVVIPNPRKEIFEALL